MPNAPCIELHHARKRLQAHANSILLANSTNRFELRKHDYLPRYSSSRDEVRIKLLTVSETTTYCPFKGYAVTFSLSDIQDMPRATKSRLR
ncbi:DUF427 domain-containing protein [Vreelandella olivaria]|uniref:DUF427 domain-containing protein n=1 Tax=Vreelandella olivaria TaxID=390919 RepID=UPI003CC90A1A